MKFVKFFTMFVAFSLLFGIVAAKTIQASEDGVAATVTTTNTTQCANPVIKYSKPTMSQAKSIDSRIVDYKILKWNGSWSEKYTPGVNDLKTTNDMSSLLGDSAIESNSRAWSDFSDHVHQYTYCPKPVVIDEPTAVDPSLLETDESVDIDACSKPIVKRRRPTRDKVWQKLGTDISKHKDIVKYRIQWSNGRWSQWYKTGVDDMDQKTNWLPLPSDYSRTSDNPDGTKRRMWSYFTDHIHEYAICDAGDAPNLKPVEDVDDPIEEKPVIKPKPSTRATVGRLLRDKKTKGVYLVKDNKKSVIVDKKILDINFKDIVVEDDKEDELKTLKQDLPVKVNEGTLLKIDGDNRVFVVDKDNKRHWIKNEQTFKKLDYHWNDVKVVSKRIFKLQKHGTELDLAK